MPSIKHEAATGRPPTVRDAVLAELDPATLYAILRLRCEVFVVEQECAYLDLDGRDAEPTARHLWVEDEGGVLATLRVLADPGGVVRIGRVVTAPQARGAGLAALLMEHAVRSAGTSPMVLDAQAHLVRWYARFGFAQDGAEFVEDGIPHVTMRRRPSPDAPVAASPTLAP